MDGYWTLQWNMRTDTRVSSGDTHSDGRDYKCAGCVYRAGLCTWLSLFIRGLGCRCEEFCYEVCCCEKIFTFWDATGIFTFKGHLCRVEQELYSPLKAAA